MSENSARSNSSEIKKTGFYIRPLGADDLESILEIERLSFPDPWSKESYKRELESNSLAHYLGCFLKNGDDERLAAYAGFWLILEEGHISNVAVHPVFRGRGVGELIMRGLMTRCYAEGGRWMTLEVRVSNDTARNLYRKLGFKDLGVRKAYYENREDAIIMWCSLSLAKPHVRAECGRENGSPGV